MFSDAFEILNDTDAELTVVLEPWAQAYGLQKNQMLRFEASSAESGEFEVVSNEGLTRLYGWPGCTLKVLRNEEIIDEWKLPLPDIPAGMTMKQFVELLFGE